MSNPSDHYVILDRTDPYGPKWVLTRRADSTGWTSAADKTAAWIPAVTDRSGFLDPDEYGRLMLWLVVTLDTDVDLDPMPNPAAYTVREVTGDE